MRYIIPIILFIFIGGCGTDSGSDSSKISVEGFFAQAGLPDIYINTFNQFEGYVYVATEGGLFRTLLGNKVISWESFGLKEDNVVDIVFLPNGEFLAAIGLKFINDGEPTLFLSKDVGQSWQVWVNNYGGETGEYTFISSLSTPITPSDTIFALGADRTIAKSVDGGLQWELVTGQWDNFGGTSSSVYINSSQPETIWASGATALGEPYILKSKDNGDSWDRINVSNNSQGIIYDVITNSEKRGTVLVGSGIGIDKSVNEGETWKNVYNNVGVFSLAQSVNKPDVVYAGGGNTSGTLFFLASGDFGDTWEMVEFEDGPTQIQVNDMISVLQNDKEVLYFGTNKGVYSYTFTE